RRCRPVHGNPPRSGARPVRRTERLAARSHGRAAGHALLARRAGQARRLRRIGARSTLNAGESMTAYVIADVKVSDPEKYKGYMALSPGAVAAAGGEFVVRGGAHEVLEGNWRPN